jgi:hypothetical protein
MNYKNKVRLKRHENRMLIDGKSKHRSDVCLYQNDIWKIRIRIKNIVTTFLAGY